MNEIEKLRDRLTWERPKSNGSEFEAVEHATHEFSDYFATLTTKLIEEFDKTNVQAERATLIPLAKEVNSAWTNIDSTYKQIPDLKTNPPTSGRQPTERQPGELSDAVNAQAEKIRDTIMSGALSRNQKVVDFLRLVEMRELGNQVPTIQKEVKNFESFRDEFKTLQDQKNDSIRAFKDTEKQLREQANAISNTQTKVQSQSDSLSDVQEELESKITALNSTIKAICDFDSLANKNWWVGRFWFVLMVAALGFTGYLVSWLFFEYPENGNVGLKPPGEGWSAIAFILQRLAIMSPLLLAVKLALTKLNSCNHLRATYLHRISALTHYWSFENAIENPEQRASLRLELAKMIFSDPQTGMIKQTDGTELNINGVIGALGRLPRGSV